MQALEVIAAENGLMINKAAQRKVPKKKLKPVAIKEPFPLRNKPTTVLKKERWDSKTN